MREVGSIAEFVRQDFNGRLLPPRDATALVEAIRQILITPGELQRLSHNAIELRDGALSWRNIAVQTMRCYQWSCARISGKVI